MININILKNKKIKILCHKIADFDSMVSGYLLEYILKELKLDADFVLQDNYVDPYFEDIAKKVGFKYELKYGINNNDYLFLVDHTDSYNNEIIGCFDHHPTISDIKTNYVNISKTCCAKIIYDWAQTIGISIPDELTILTIYACYIDSISFKSTKAVLDDKQWCLLQLKKYNIDENEITIWGYALTPKNLSLVDYLSNGLKQYNVKDKVIKASYIAVDKDIDNDDEVIKVLKDKVIDIDAWCLIVSNVIKEETKIYLITKEYTLIQTIKKLLSRGKDIIPAIIEILSFNNDGNLTKKLIDKNIQVATMESCTSGLIASNITDYEGASAILKGSSITYSNEVKIKAGVSANVINIYGVYSPETAVSMAYNAKNTFKANIGIGITGSFGNVDPANKDSIAGSIDFMILSKISKTPIKLLYNNIDISRKEIKQKTVDIVLSVLNIIVEKL
jgi:PncC family amidohydrolase